MSDEQKQSDAARRAGLHFRKEKQVQEGKAAWTEYNAQVAATRVKTEKLRAQRLARDASEAAAIVPPAKTARVRAKSK